MTPMTRFLPLVLLALLLAPEASAQFALGAQLGTPTGVSAKFGSGSGSVILAAGWDLGDSEALAVEGHYIFAESRIPGDADLALFYGPGVFLNARDGRETQAGVSFGVGLSLYATRRVELYGLVSPRLQLVDETGFDLGGGVGGRFTF